MFGGLLLSYGRTNIAVAIVLLLIIWIIAKLRFKSIVTITVIALFISVTAVQFNSVELNWRANNTVGLSDRDVIIKGFTQIYDEHPFLGFGPRTFHEVFPITDQLADKNIGSWHNDYIQIYVESGVIELIIFLILNLTIIYNAAKFIWQNKSDIYKNELLFGNTFAIIALLLSALTSGFIFNPVLSIVYMFLIARHIAVFEKYIHEQYE